MRPIYKAIYRLEPDGQWRVDIPELNGCSARAKTFQEARLRIREALARVRADGAAVEIIDEIFKH